MKPVGPTNPRPTGARCCSSLVLVCLLASSLALGVPREPAPAPAVAQPATSETYLLTWTATSEGSVTFDLAGAHNVQNRHIRSSGSAIVTIPTGGASDALISN